MSRPPSRPRYCSVLEVKPPLKTDWWRQTSPPSCTTSKKSESQNSQFFSTLQKYLEPASSSCPPRNKSLPIKTNRIHHGSASGRRNKELTWGGRGERALDTTRHFTNKLAITSIAQTHGHTTQLHSHSMPSFLCNATTKPRAALLRLSPTMG